MSELASVAIDLTDKPIIKQKPNHFSIELNDLVLTGHSIRVLDSGHIVLVGEHDRFIGLAYGSLADQIRTELKRMGGKS